ncbi:MAG TPA: hypothetical protein DHV59_14505 [Oxalobacteraceae bacterium]|nr:hypothetical protein [Oxalobacteraceae bacterium]
MAISGQMWQLTGPLTEQLTGAAFSIKIQYKEESAGTKPDCFCPSSREVRQLHGKKQQTSA